MNELLPPLDAHEFRDFFAAVHGKDFAPFPWQARLADALCRGQQWPALLDLPTGAGKTAAIDIAVFLLALQADWHERRRAPMRIVFVGDRRLAVDSAFERAQKLAAALGQPGARPDLYDRDILLRVAARLRHLAGEHAPPLAAARLSAGLPKEPDWVRSPCQPAVIVSTIDQVGSRLLFRGYGVPSAMLPVHAGLLGTDALLLLDEVHRSRPFVDTVRDLPGAAARRFVVVTLCATPPDEPCPSRFTLSERDWQHEVLGPRLHASKITELVKVPADSGSAEFVDAFVARAWRASTLDPSGSAQVVAVVVNRVGRARAIHAALERLLATQPAGQPAAKARPQAVLLIGRNRPIPRDEGVQGMLQRIQAGRPDETQAPLFIVATQCVEAGADLDFDALICEIAPLDVLRQRFGRLDRLGRFGRFEPLGRPGRVGERPTDHTRRSPVAVAAILAARNQIGPIGQNRSDAVDPIYGPSSRRTWDWLDRHPVLVGSRRSVHRAIDFGVAASRDWLPTGKDLADCLSQGGEAPVLLPAYVDLWTQTSPLPAADPAVAPFLHGPGAEPAEVQIVWRADLSDDSADGWVERVRACPPSTLETLAVGVQEARRWFAGTAVGEVADIEGGPREADEDLAPGGPSALRWCGDDGRTQVIDAGKELRPGDLLVVPASRGGCDRFGWDPRSNEPVADLAEDDRIGRQRGRDVLRLSPALVRLALLDELPVDLPAVALQAARAAGEARVGRIAALLDSLSDDEDDNVVEFLGDSLDTPASWSRRLSGPAPRGGQTVLRDQAGLPLAIEREWRPWPPMTETPETPDSSDPSEPPDSGDGVGVAASEDDQSCGRPGAQPVTLDAHAQGVEEQAGAFARQAGLPPAQVEDVALAAFLHDAGKAHPQFKMWLYGGDALSARGPALAQSGRIVPGRPARLRSSLPAGARHEAASLRYAVHHPRFVQAHDPDLVLWLIGTHHGWGRPFFPPVRWPATDDSGEFELCGEKIPMRAGWQVADAGTGWIDLFVVLKNRYGPWGLAHLEASLRLADHRRP